LTNIFTIVLAFIKENVLCDICLVLGILALYITYIGAPLASQKSGHYVSGIPCIGGIFIAIGFLTTPYKWLALLGFIDIQILYLLYILFQILTEKIKDSTR
jgi:hypothetical protein